MNTSVEIDEGGCKIFSWAICYSFAFDLQAFSSLLILSVWCEVRPLINAQAVLRGHHSMIGVTEPTEQMSLQYWRSMKAQIEGLSLA